jgi:hypothetical protein
MHQDNRERDCSDADASQGIPRPASNPSRARKKQRRILAHTLNHQREYDPADTLLSFF